MAGLAEAEFYGNLDPMLDNLHAPSVPVQPVIAQDTTATTTRVSILQYNHLSIFIFSY